MSRNYKFHHAEALYFVSFAVIEWIDVFTRKIYNDIFLDAIRYSMEHKKMNVYAWCIMSNHVHLVFSVADPFKPELVLGDIKRFTSRQLTDAIKNNDKESRRKWMMQLFSDAGKQTSNTSLHQFWRHDNHPIELFNEAMFRQQSNYIHYNPVIAGIVTHPEHYSYSSAIDYVGGTGLLEAIKVLC